MPVATEYLIEHRAAIRCQGFGSDRWVVALFLSPATEAKVLIPLFNVSWVMYNMRVGIENRDNSDTLLALNQRSTQVNFQSVE